MSFFVWMISFTRGYQLVSYQTSAQWIGCDGDADGSAALSLVYQFFVTHYGLRSAFWRWNFLWVMVVIPESCAARGSPRSGLYPMVLAVGRDNTAELKTETMKKSMREHSWPRREAMPPARCGTGR